MSLAKTGYADATRGTMSQKISLRGDGTIAQEGDTVEGVKRLTFTNANAANSAATNQNIVRAFLDFVGNGQSDQLTNRISVTWEVEGA